MKKILTAVLVGFTLFLTGCHHNPVVPEVQVKTVLKTVPEEMLVRCVSETPPDRTKYINASAEEREELAITFASKQTTNLRKCAETVEGVRTWGKEQRKVYGQDPIPK